MAAVKPFYCIRPREDRAAQVAALPYDVYDREEARQAVAGRPLLFLNIDRPETQFAENVDMYDDRVYDKARELFDRELARGVFVREEKPCYFLYELTMDGRSQTGVVACCAIDDYLGNVIKKHENTREEKEQDRIRHVDRMNAQTGPIFLAYRQDEEIRRLKARVKSQAPIYDFVTEDGVGHRVWRTADPEICAALEAAFGRVPALYIADGHHRAASAVRVGRMRRAADPGYSGSEEYNFFLSVLFPSDELRIYDYNRVVTDRNGCTFDSFLDKIKGGFKIRKTGKEACRPERKGGFGLYCEGNWYQLTASPALYSDDPVRGLDVSILQEYILSPVFGISDPKTDPRIRFIGGIRGLKALEEAADESGGFAFSMYPTSMDELLSVADAGMLMPPKSTWFEPKLRSGLFIHRF